MAKKMGFQSRLLLVVFILSALAALPTTVVFFIGMLPTIASRLSDKAVRRTRVLTVGFMNFATCFPYWFQLMHKGHNFANAVDLITDPVTIVIMYMGALAGYLIEWGLSGIVGGLMVGKGRKRLDDIQSQQADLIERWGPEVAGDIPLDPSGFPIESAKH